MGLPEEDGELHGFDFLLSSLNDLLRFFNSFVIFSAINMGTGGIFHTISKVDELLVQGKSMIDKWFFTNETAIHIYII